MRFQSRGGSSDQDIAATRRLLFVAAVCIASATLSPGPAGAVDKFAAEFLKIGVGARALGMGGAFVSLANDASATYWNPAGLVQLESREAMGMHASQFGGVVAHDVLGVVAPLSSDDKNSAIGLTIIRLGVDDIKVTDGYATIDDGNGNPILVDEDGNEVSASSIPKKSAYDLAFLLSYARGFGDTWSGGLNVKLVRQSLVGEGASFGIGADLGFWWQPKPNLAFGARLADITTTQLFWDTGRRETVSPTVTLGAHTTRSIAAVQGTLTIGVDAGFAFERQKADQFLDFWTPSLSANLHPGAEYWFRKTVALRAGSDAGNLTAGAGVRYKQVGADYAYLSHDELDSTHRVSALIRF
jgi:hypothetical protein